MLFHWSRSGSSNALSCIYMFKLYCGCVWLYKVHRKDLTLITSFYAQNNATFTYHFQGLLQVIPAGIHKYCWKQKMVFELAPSEYRFMLTRSYHTTNPFTKIVHIVHTFEEVVLMFHQKLQTKSKWLHPS